MRQPTKGAMITVTGELLASFFNLPKDAKIFKMIPSNSADYCFDILYFSDEEWEIEEGGYFPRKPIKFGQGM